MFLKKFIAPIRKLLGAPAEVPSAEECVLVRQLRELMELTDPNPTNTKSDHLVTEMIAKYSQQHIADLPKHG